MSFWLLQDYNNATSLNKMRAIVNTYARRSKFFTNFIITQGKYNRFIIYGAHC